MVSAPWPVLVKAWLPPLWPIAPLSVSVAATAAVVLPVSVTVPLLSDVPVATSAPIPATPVPERLKASVPMSTPLSSSVAPLDTVVAPVTVPRAALLLAISLPVLTVVRPL